MPVREPFPELNEILASIGEAGGRIAAIGASEGGAGNISVCIGWPIEVRRQFPVTEEIPLPLSAPHLAGRRIIVTGSGRRLRDIATDPAANLGVVLVHAGGETGTLHTSPRCLFDGLTSEWNSHLGIHDDAIARADTNYHAVLHAQPPHLVYLSHVPEYRDEAYFNRRLLRWEPETIVNLPQGVGVLAFMLPGSAQLMEANVASLRTHRVVLWGKHGVMARSDISVTRAADRIEYAETAARYEYMDLVAGQRAEGLSLDEMRAVVAAFNVTTDRV
ncbi:MAG TPA: class II aldolase/adducin family protein [Cryobacterium sp.]|jgi:rhamnulose-1-phosphate aldolase|nr:class II aldolase/adducin family protein [Cryobacterium sp.]